MLRIHSFRVRATPLSWDNIRLINFWDGIGKLSLSLWLDASWRGHLGVGGHVREIWVNCTQKFWPAPQSYSTPMLQSYGDLNPPSCAPGGPLRVAFLPLCQHWNTRISWKNCWTTLFFMLLWAKTTWSNYLWYMIMCLFVMFWLNKCHANRLLSTKTTRTTHANFCFDYIL